eukprot:213121-Rhodomonas_salina.1
MELGLRGRFAMVEDGSDTHGGVAGEDAAAGLDDGRSEPSTQVEMEAGSQAGWSRLLDGDDRMADVMARKLSVLEALRTR